MSQLASALAIIALATEPQSGAPSVLEAEVARTSLPQTAEAAVAAEPAAIVIPEDTPIHLMTLTEVTTKTDQIGHRFKLRVNKDVQINGVMAIPVGTLAWGEVTSAESSGNLGKAGNLTARLLYVELHGQQIPISGDTSVKGRTATAETVVGVLSLGVFGLFAKGNNAKIKAGEKITAFVTAGTTIKRSAK